MENTARLYLCARCRRRVTICSHCDRGNIYCGKSCADRARTLSLRAAGKRYQRTRRGRFKHAERQRRYRSGRKKVTHQGSPEPPPDDPLTARSQASAPIATAEDEGIRCGFCGRPCSPFLRSGFLRGATSPPASDRKIVQGPPPARGQAP